MHNRLDGHRTDGPRGAFRRRRHHVQFRHATIASGRTMGRASAGMVRYLTLASAAGAQIKCERSELPRAPDCSKHRYAKAS
jgi:hypothetical protein